MIGSAIIGGVLLALIEGMGILFMRYTSEQFRPQNPLEDPSQLGSPIPGGPSSSSQSPQSLSDQMASPFAAQPQYQ